jgi:hypothetical protein
MSSFVWKFRSAKFATLTVPAFKSILKMLSHQPIAAGLL